MSETKRTIITVSKFDPQSILWAKAWEFQCHEPKWCCYKNI